MGSSISHFAIVLDQDQGQHELLPLLAGCTFHGKVIVEVKSPIRLPVVSTSSTNNQQQRNNQRTSILQLRLYGKEKVRMNSRKAKCQKGKGSPSKVAERQFLNIPLEWDTFPIDNTESNVIPIGTYVFPFHIQLPDSIPSSTYHPMNDPNRVPSKMRFRIQYKLIATIHLPNNQKDSMTSNKAVSINTKKPDYKTTRYVWISAASKPLSSSSKMIEPVPCMVEPITQQLQNAFFQKGMFIFGACIDNIQLYKRTNEMIALHISCRNDSTIQIHNVQISIIEKVIWGTTTQSMNQIDPNTGIHISSSTLQQTEYIPLSILDNVQLPGLVKESKGIIKSMIESMFGTTKQNLQKQIYQDLISGENLIPIPLPIQNNYNNNNNKHDTMNQSSITNHNTNIRESYCGQLIQISHYVKIVFQTGTFCKKPTLEIPIRILPNPISIDETNNTIATLANSGTGTATYKPPPSKNYSNSSKIPSILPTTTTTNIVSSSVNNGSNTTSSSDGSMEVTMNAVSTSSDPNHIPMATAVVVLPNNTETIQANEMTSNVIVLGGDAILSPPIVSSLRTRFNNTLRHNSSRTSIRNSNNNYGNNTNTQSTSPIPTAPLSKLVPLSVPTKQFENTISIPALLCSMRSSVNEYEYIQSKICEPEWMDLFHSMSCNEYGTIVGNVQDFDQPRVAILLAPFINYRNGGCTCSYAASAIRHTSTHHRAITAQKLIPICIDIHENYTLILDELNGWEQTITEQTLADAMS